MMKSLKKITLPEIGIVIPAGGGEYLGKTVALLGGEVSGYSLKISNYGESKAFSGNFIAVNNQTGEVHEANTMYFPGSDYADVLAQQLERLQPGETLSFQVEVAVVESKKAGRGYSFVCREISTPEVMNKKAALAAELVSKLKMLPAPTVGDAPAKTKKTA